VIVSPEACCTKHFSLFRRIGSTTAAAYNHSKQVQMKKTPQKYIHKAQFKKTN